MFALDFADWDPTSPRMGIATVCGESGPGGMTEAEDVFLLPCGSERWLWSSTSWQEISEYERPGGHERRPETTNCFL